MPELDLELSVNLSDDGKELTRRLASPHELTSCSVDGERLITLQKLEPFQPRQSELRGT